MTKTRSASWDARHDRSWLEKHTFYIESSHWNKQDCRNPVSKELIYLIRIIHHPYRVESEASFFIFFSGSPTQSMWSSLVVGKKSPNTSQRKKYHTKILQALAWQIWPWSARPFLHVGTASPCPPKQNPKTAKTCLLTNKLASFTAAAVGYSKKRLFEVLKMFFFCRYFKKSFTTSIHHPRIRTAMPIFHVHLLHTFWTGHGPFLLGQLGHQMCHWPHRVFPASIAGVWRCFGPGHTAIGKPGKYDLRFVWHVMIASTVLQN